MEGILTPVDPNEVPNFRDGRRGRIAYSLAKQFLELNAPVVKVDHRALGRTLTSLSTGMSAYVKSHELPIKVMQRAGELYLVRLDLNADGSKNEDYKPATQEEPVDLKKALEEVE